ncbi:IclR family transcriptional regulator [Arthrobacter silvisoli]|uniref:IclR family transcriptional regulator n=1 Tax=Arthrobacter silvisoli TaxID=2291022 RepID=UPI000E21902E|nr:IclR family transcriptional regulator C-terminal domain-containing protein [Arthrobacter silvisoli]
METSPEASTMAQGLRIVRLVTEREKSGRQLLGVSQLAAELQLDQSRVSRLTQELCDIGLLEREERGPFRAGPRFFRLAASLNNGWFRGAGPELEKLVSSLGLRARVSVRVGFRVLLVRASSNDMAAGSFAYPGMITPVWCTGAGRALLWDHKRKGLDALLQDVSFIGVGGPQAAHSVAEVWELMVRDRPQGYVAAAEEFEHGIHELAAPVRDDHGRVTAALSVLGQYEQLRGDLSRVAGALLDSAARLSGVSRMAG